MIAGSNISLCRSTRSQHSNCDGEEAIYRLVCIVGAGRSGTNLLGHALAAENSLFKNLFENRYIWSYGQKDLSCDIRTQNDLTPSVATYIQTHFSNMRSNPIEILIDKTPSNALRIPFVHALFPEAKIIHIIRDGRDNVLSRHRQWGAFNLSNHASSDRSEKFAKRFSLFNSRLAHLRNLTKRKNLPIDRVPLLLKDAGFSFIKHFLTGTPTRYGERVPGLADVLRLQGIDAAAAVQWRDVVMTCVVDGRRLSNECYLEVRYEDIMNNSEVEFLRVLKFIGVTTKGDGIAYLRQTLRKNNTKKWCNETDIERINRLEPLLRPTLEFLGYQW